MDKINRSLIYLVAAIIFSCKTEMPTEYENAASNCRAYFESNKDEFRVKKEGYSGDYIQATSDCFEGLRIPDFYRVSIDGENFSRASLYGKPTVINFWFKKCKPCVQSVPKYNSVVERVGADKCNFLAISLDSEEELRSFLKDNEYSFTHIANGGRLYNDVFALYHGFPSTVVIDKKGHIRKIITKNSNRAEIDIDKRILAELLPLL